MRVHKAKYYVIRRHRILRYPACFGPVVLSIYDRQREAERLFGREGHVIEVGPWASAPKWVLIELAEKAGDEKRLRELSRNRMVRVAHF